jgi:hypothetical protein
MISVYIIRGDIMNILMKIAFDMIICYIFLIIIDKYTLENWVIFIIIGLIIDMLIFVAKDIHKDYKKRGKLHENN